MPSAPSLIDMSAAKRASASSSVSRAMPCVPSRADGLEAVAEDRQKRERTLTKLRRLIERIEGRPAQVAGPSPSGMCEATRLRQSGATAWRLGAPELDDRIGFKGLDPGGVHEIKPSLEAISGNWAGASCAAAGFAFAMSARHRMVANTRVADLPLAFCQSRAMTGELGQLYPWGLPSYALAPADMLLVEPRHDNDVLWAAETCLRSGGVRCLITRVQDVDLTAARRLALVAAEHQTPCLLLTDARAPVAAATTTRWSVGPDPCASDPFDARAPGARRFRVVLERCRSRPFAAQPGAFVLEWCDEAFCLRVVAGLRDRTASPRLAPGEVPGELIAGAFGAGVQGGKRMASAA